MTTTMNIHDVKLTAEIHKLKSSPFAGQYYVTLKTGNGGPAITLFMEPGEWLRIRPAIEMLVENVDA